jgi:ABC-type spermidine/putrescine transport system permease subunit II
VNDSRAERRLVAGIGGLTIAFLLLPMIVVALASLDPGLFFTIPPESVSGKWYGEFLGNPDWRSSLNLSLSIAFWTGIASFVVGGMAGIAIARCAPRTRKFLYVLLVAPLTVPPIVIAISLYPLALERDATGELWAFVLANTMLSAPIVALLTVGAALAVDPRVEHASLACGASRWRTLTRVTFPTIAPTAAAGGLLAFLSTLDEVVLSIFLVAPGRTPLPVRMFLEVQSASPAVVTAAATLLIGVAIVIVGGLTIARNLVERSGRVMKIDQTDVGASGA